MANENGFTGYKYVVDAKNSRQYAIPYVDGAPQLPIEVFAARTEDKGLKPNEVILAFSEESENNIVQQKDGTYELQTMGYQLTVDSKGQVTDMVEAPINYRLSVGTDKNGRTFVRYTVSEDNLSALTQEGFNANVVPSYILPVDVSIGNVDLAIVAAMLPFPKQHGEGAFLAHQKLDGKKPAAVKRNIPVTSNDPVENIPVSNNNPEGNNPSNEFNKKASGEKVAKPVEYKEPDAKLEGLLKKYCRDLTALAEAGQLDPVIGREQEVTESLKILNRRKQSSLCFTGDAGVGKSAMFAAVAQRIADNKGLPKSLQGARIVELDLQAMNAGAKYRGQFEERIKPLIEGLRERGGVLKGKKIIIAIDELHSQLTAGAAEGGSDAGNMMKPFLTANGISVMGTTTDAEYKKHIEKDPALSSRFEKKRLDAPNATDTVLILKGLWPLTKEHNELSVDLTDEDLNYIVTMTNRYAPQESQPRKGEKVMNTAAASAAFDGRTEISREDVLTAIAQMSSLPVDFLNQSDYERFLRLETELPREVLGQPGLQRIVDGLIGSRSGLADENQPWGCFVLQGPTGVGKTETCKALARYLFGTEDALIKLDMSEYAEKHTVSRLIGAPPGYVGFEDAEPALTEKIRQRPYAILLLDEIEKASPDVLQVLLPILNDGKMSDNQGKTVLFNNVILVMTTNAGASQVMKLLHSEGDKRIAFDGDMEKKEDTPEELAAKLEKLYKKAISEPSEGRGVLFRPEMINRIEELGGFITFLPLTQEVTSNLVVREIGKVNKRLSSPAGANMKGVMLAVSPTTVAQLSKEGYNPTMGARPLRKVVREKISNPLGKWLMGHKQELTDFIAANGPATIVIDHLQDFAPRIVKQSEVLFVEEVKPAAVVDVAKKEADTKGRPPLRRPALKAG